MVESKSEYTPALEELNAIAFMEHNNTARTLFLVAPGAFIKRIIHMFSIDPPALVQAVVEMNVLLQSMYHEAEAKVNEDGTEFLNMTEVTERADEPIRLLVEKMQQAVPD
jgi:hypothetical protein